MSKKVLLFLAEGFEAYEAAVFTDVMGWSREPDTKGVNLETTALRPVVKCLWNLIVQPEIPFSEINVDDYDALAIPGGDAPAGFYEDAYDERFLNLIREFDRKGKIIASVCVGALPVAKSGVLNGRKATTWDLNDGYRRKHLVEFGADVIDSPIVTDRNIITSTGPATGIGVALKLLEMLTDKNSADKVSRNMRFDTII